QKQKGKGNRRSEEDLLTDCLAGRLATLPAGEVCPSFIRQRRESNLKSNEVRRVQKYKVGGRRLALPLE
ncbi:Uncharacterized protein APZ42_003888, partial [Daphnia magna]